MSELISIIMGVYNCEKTLIEAVRSIQGQSYTNWEFIICDDGSTDETWSLLTRLAQSDKRIVLLKNDQNLGLGATLNKCIKAAKGDIIARMDGDDISLPMRLEKELYYLKNHPETAIVSCRIALFDKTGIWRIGDVIPEPAPKDVVCRSSIVHPASMMRRSCLIAVGCYSEEKGTLRVEDTALWIHMYAAGYRCHNLSECLYHIRSDMNAIRRQKYRYRINATHVRLNGCRVLHLGVGSYLMALRPMIVGLIPGRMRFAIKKRIQ